MPLNREALQKLERKIIATLEGRNPLIEVPYYVCLYNPEYELEVLESFGQMVQRLKGRGYSAEVIMLSDLMLEILERHGLLTKEVFEKEEAMRGELEKELRDKLTRKRGKISDVLEERLKGKPLSHCAVLLRYGALWPFVHLSQIFIEIEGVVECTLVIPYPSEKGLGYPLNKRSEGVIDYYRAEEVELN